MGGDLKEPSLRVEEKIKSLDISDNRIISNYLSDADFEIYIMMSDIILNFRYPSLGVS